jgi:hypothetical protein
MDFKTWQFLLLVKGSIEHEAKILIFWGGSTYFACFGVFVNLFAFREIILIFLMEGLLNLVSSS